MSNIIYLAVFAMVAALASAQYIDPLLVPPPVIPPVAPILPPVDPILPVDPIVQPYGTGLGYGRAGRIIAAERAIEDAAILNAEASALV
ncbi:unnamed protein product [Bursaphelenchus xylophilus]|uniref:(pine wood nematode) hypothetical protein n=1 Tax=Bursaphelenchus xylophilus TaxID=6326 RepID=A0A1I7RJ01_BURXY|nr:unnamed protein product [Bursaphelenchus xylophilus]CAG9119203.1 unnamed protein product [Bursaphelenchus xylophilus]